MKCNPFHAIYDSTGETLQGSMFGSAFGGALAPEAEPAKDVKVEVPVTLQEFYHGCVKLVVYKRQTLALDGYTVREEGEECVKAVVIKAGQVPGATLKYKGEGNEQFKRQPTDLIITLVEDSSNSEGNTRRKGNDLIYTCKVTLQQAIRAEPATVETLDGRLIKVPVDHVITPRTVIKIDGEGMPILPSAQPTEGDSTTDPLDAPRRGDLYVKFDIQFPRKLTESQRQRIEAVFQ